jgi:hypothetical protein
LLGVPLAASPPASPVEVPLLRLLDKHAAFTSAEIQRFYGTVWDEAVRLFRSCDVALRTVDKVGEIRRYPSGRPRIVGLERKMMNAVLTDSIPLAWAMAAHFVA